MHVDLDTRTVREGRRRVEGVPAAQPVAATGGITPKITDAELITVAVIALVLVVVIDSLPDIKRYFEIRDMLDP